MFSIIITIIKLFNQKFYLPKLIFCWYSRIPYHDVRPQDDLSNLKSNKYSAVPFPGKDQMFWVWLPLYPSKTFQKEKTDEFLIGLFPLYVLLNFFKAGCEKLLFINETQKVVKCLWSWRRHLFHCPKRVEKLTSPSHGFQSNSSIATQKLQVQGYS